MPLTFSLSTQTDPKPRTYLNAMLGEHAVGGAVYPHNWSNAFPEPPLYWSWSFSIGPWKWQKPSGRAASQGEAQTRLSEAYAAFLGKFGLQEGGTGARAGSLTLHRNADVQTEDYDIMVAGEVLGRLRYPEGSSGRWSVNVWLEPFGSGGSRLCDTRDEAMGVIREIWNGWLHNRGLSERPE